jgi:hypothetical protein
MHAAAKGTTAARAEDVASIDAVIATMYGIVSGPPGERDWERLRTLYWPGARMIPIGLRPSGDEGLRMFSIDEYIANAAPFFREEAFYERELSRTTERFGDIAHAFSTYGSFRSPADAEPFMRGINSIQLLWRAGRWWVVNVFWDNETPGNPIPARYLPVPG